MLSFEPISLVETKTMKQSTKQTRAIDEVGAVLYGFGLGCGSNLSASRVRVMVLCYWYKLGSKMLYRQTSDAYASQFHSLDNSALH